MAIDWDRERLHDASPGDILAPTLEACYREFAGTMPENPYQPPSDLPPKFYTDDITSMPVTAIWRIARRKGLLGCLFLFPTVLVRKAFKNRFPANHAVSRIVALSPILDEELPSDIRDTFAPFEAACRNYELEHVLSFRPPWIGGRSAVFSFWLHPSGKVFCNITRINIKLGSFSKTATVFACHSRLDSGVELHTSPVAPENWIPELVPPNQDLERLAPGTDPSEVIDRHLKRTAGRSGIVRFTRETLLEEIIRSSQEHFDFLVAKGIYTPLTVAEVQRLSR